MSHQNHRPRRPSHSTHQRQGVPGYTCISENVRTTNKNCRIRADGVKISKYTTFSNEWSMPGVSREFVHKQEVNLISSHTYIHELDTRQGIVKSQQAICKFWRYVRIGWYCRGRGESENSLASLTFRWIEDKIVDIVYPRIQMSDELCWHCLQSTHVVQVIILPRDFRRVGDMIRKKAHSAVEYRILDMLRPKT